MSISNCPECHTRPKWYGNLSHSPTCSLIDLDTAKWYAKESERRISESYERAGVFDSKAQRWEGKFRIVCHENNKLRAENERLRAENVVLKNCNGQVNAMLDATVGKPTRTDDKISLAIAALGGETHRPEACMCDPEVGACPCMYCAELDGLMAAKYELKHLRAETARLDALARSNAQAHNRVEDERFSLLQENKRLQSLLAQYERK